MGHHDASKWTACFTRIYTAPLYTSVWSVAGPACPRLLVLLEQASTAAAALLVAVESPCSFYAGNPLSLSASLSRSPRVYSGASHLFLSIGIHCEVDSFLYISSCPLILHVFSFLFFTASCRTAIGLVSPLQACSPILNRLILLLLLPLLNLLLQRHNRQ